MGYEARISTIRLWRGRDEDNWTASAKRRLQQQQHQRRLRLLDEKSAFADLLISIDVV